MLKKLMFFVFIVLFSFSSQTFAANQKNDFKGVLSQLIPPTIKYDVKVLKKSVLKGYTQLDVIIKDEKMGMKIHRYIWISKDKKSVIPTILTKNAIGRFQRLMPKNYMEHFPINLSWFFDIVKQLPKEMKLSYGKGKTVYMLSDPYCPFCKKELGKLKKLAAQGKIKLYIIPFDVHGPKAEEASLVFLNIEKQKGLLAAINQVEGASFQDVDKIVKQNKKSIDALNKKYSKYLKNIVQTAMKNGVRGTPAMVIPTKGNKGYLIVGLSDITPYLK